MKTEEMSKKLKAIWEQFSNFVKWNYRVIKETLFPKPGEIWKKKKTPGISVMSLNLRGDKAKDKSHTWVSRRESMVKMIRDKCPDIICCQEGWSHMIKYLKTKIGYNYDSYGIGTFSGKDLDKTLLTTLGNVVFYDKNKFEVESKEVFWLSENPEERGSRSWETSEPRNCIVLKLKHKETGEYYTIFGTHFDHVSSWARTRSSEIVMEKAKKYKYESKVIFVGDFNATISENELSPFKDLNYYPKPGFVTTTFNGFSKYKKTVCDYIILLGDNEDHLFEQITDGYGVPYITDHYPMMVVI